MPVPADHVTAKCAPVRHSLVKWYGLRESNLRRHGGRADDTTVFFTDRNLFVDATSCALCVLHTEPGSTGEPDCSKCALTAVRGAPCYEGDGNPYLEFWFRKNPEPMIELLKQAQEQGHL
jgi:hypothetical protein